MDPLAKVVRDRMQASKPETHPDANLLAAFAENSLRDAERSQVMEHLAACADCREIAALSLPAQEQQEHYAAAAAAAPVPRLASEKTSWFRPRMVLRWGGLAACVIVATFMILQRQERQFANRPYATVNETEPTGMRAPEPTSQPSEFKKSADDKLEAMNRLQAPPKAELRDSPSRLRAQREELEKSMTTRKEAGSSFMGKLGGNVSPAAPTTVIAPGVVNETVQVAAAPPPPPPPVSAGAAEATGAKPAESSQGAALGGLSSLGRVSGSAKVPSTSQSVEVVAQPQATAETVEVTGANAPVDKRQKAKTDDQFKAEVQKQASTIVSAQSDANYLGDEKDKDLARSNVRLPASRWKLSPKGELMRSIDLGESWHIVTPAAGFVSNAVAVIGREVWIGGANGVLYHTADAGEHWVRVKPVADGKELESDIIGLEFSDVLHGKVTTITHETWITSDNGLNWKKK